MEKIHRTLLTLCSSYFGPRGISLLKLSYTFGKNPFVFKKNPLKIRVNPFVLKKSRTLFLMSEVPLALAFALIKKSLTCDSCLSLSYTIGWKTKALASLNLVSNWLGDKVLFQTGKAKTCRSLAIW